MAVVLVPTPSKRMNKPNLNRQ